MCSRYLAALLFCGALMLGLVPAPLDGQTVSKQWVFFVDKGLTAERRAAAIADFRARLSPRALARRAKVGIDVNENDLPVAQEYVEAVRDAGAEIVTKSRWLNAVSILGDETTIEAIRGLPFVKEVRPVACATKPIPLPSEPPGDRPVGRGGRLDYGPSFCQLDQIGVTALHDEGFDGTGVLIAMLDTGFDTDHQCFRHLDVLGERDFINDDAETADEPGDPEGQDSHGTKTLSCVGAAYPGELYGGAYNASFALAKTEKIDEEIQAEEDYWVEAVEWADSLGADIVSSSLGYLDWYTYEDMDGNTAVVTRAADMAAARGIVVLNSMGNEGGGAWRYMIAPADGDSVISVGAVDCDGARVWFSSVGPTYDGRIKPDVMALGLEARVATSTDTASYGYSSGTSFSCPLTAGAVGLLLQGHPEWTPVDVIEALHATASQSTSPDTLMGWGIVSAYDAMYSEPLGIDGSEPVDVARLVWVVPNPSRAGARIGLNVRSPGRVTIRIYDAAGRVVRSLFDGSRLGGPVEVEWDGRDASGVPVASGVYFVEACSVGSSDATKVVVLR